MRILDGRVLSGYGVATAVLGEFHETIEIRAGHKLAPGTLNVELREPITVRPDFILSADECHGLEEFIKFQRCRISGVEGIIMRTRTQEAGSSHPLSIIEVMASVHLRQLLGLQDGASVTVEVEV